MLSPPYPNFHVSVTWFYKFPSGTPINTQSSVMSLTARRNQPAWWTERCVGGRGFSTGSGTFDSVWLILVKLICQLQALSSHMWYEEPQE